MREQTEDVTTSPQVTGAQWLSQLSSSVKCANSIECEIDLKTKFNYMGNMDEIHKKLP